MNYSTWLQSMKTMPQLRFNAFWAEHIAMFIIFNAEIITIERKKPGKQIVFFLSSLAEYCFFYGNPYQLCCVYFPRY